MYSLFNGFIFLFRFNIAKDDFTIYMTEKIKNFHLKIEERTIFSWCR